jgi:hypothetical protein
MVHTAKRNSARCPTHPGAFLREDVIPATGRTKAELHRFSASLANISAIFCASGSQCLLL